MNTRSTSTVSPFGKMDDLILAAAYETAFGPIPTQQMFGSMKHKMDAPVSIELTQAGTAHIHHTLETPAIDKLTSTPVEVHHTTDPITFNFPQLGPILDSFSQAIDRVKSSVVGSPEEKVDYVRMVELAIAACSAIWALIESTSITQSLAIITLFVTASGLTSTCKEYLTSFVNILAGLRNYFTPEQQGNDDKPIPKDVDNVFWSLVKVIRSMFSWQTEKEMDLSNHRLKRFMSHMTFLKKTKDFFSYIFTMMKEAFEYIYLWKYKVPWAPKEQQELARKVNDFTMRVLKLTKFYSEIRQESVFDFSKFYEVQNLLFEGEAIAQEITAFEAFKHNVTHFNAAVSALNTLYVQLKQDKRVSAGRQPPFNTWLVGQPGVGKTLLFGLIPAFHAAVEEKEFNANWIWARNLGEEFWSNYRGQRFALMDDITQVPDPDKLSEYIFEFINASGDVPYAVKMPDLDSKGSTFFTSEDIIITSNDKAIPSSKALGIANRNAVCRRVDLFVEVRAKGQTAEQVAVVDYGKPIDYNRYEFRIGDPFNELEPFKDSAPIDFVDFMGVYFLRKMKKKGGATSAITSLINHPEILLPAKKEFQIRWGARLAEAQLQIEELENQRAEQLEAIKESKKEQKDEAIIPMTQCNEDACPHFRKRKDVPDLTDKEYLDLDFYLKKSGAIRNFYEEKTQKTFREMLNDITLETKLARDETLNYLIEMKKHESRKTALHYIIDALVIASGVVSLVHLLSSAKEATQQSLGHYLKWRSIPKKQKIVQPQPKVVPIGQSGEIQQQMSEQYLSITENVVSPNAVTIWTEAKNGRVKTTNATFVGGHMFITTSHFFTIAYQAGELEFHTSRGTYIVKRQNLQLSQIKEYDLCFGVINDAQFPVFKTIFHHFCTEKDLEMEIGNDIMLVTRTLKNTTICMMMTNAKRQDITLVRNAKGEYLNIYRTIGGKIPTAAGDCGAVYIVLNDQWVHKIIAMHNAGTGVKGWGVIVTQELLKLGFGESFAIPTTQTGTVKVIPYDKTKTQTVLPEQILDNIEVIGLIDPPYHIPTKNPIEPSPISGIFCEPIEQPTILHKMKKSDGTTVDPAVQMFKKLNRTSKCDAKPEVVHEIARCLAERFPNDFPYRLLTDFEILNGVQGRKELKPVVLSASPGYPFNTQHLGKGKTPFLHRGEDGFIHYDPEFKKYFDHWRWRLENDFEKLREEPESVAFCYFLKQERVSPTKLWEYHEPTQEEIEKLKGTTFLKEDDTRNVYFVKEPLLDIRGIAAAHLCLFLTMRQYFGALIINRFCGDENDHCKVGINPHSYDWTKLYEQAIKYGPDRLRFGDCKKYDSSVKYILSSEATWAYNEVYRQRHSGDYETKHEHIRMRLHDLVHNGLVILRDVLFRTKAGNQSGQLNTTTENCDTFLIALVYTIWEHCRERGIPITIREIIEILMLADWGDDDFWALPPELDSFTTPEFARLLKKYFDMDYTSADKKSELKDMYNIREVTFLCRTFDPEDYPAWTFAPVELAVIDDSLNWCDPSKVGVKKAVESNVETACYEYWHHREELFEQRRQALNQAMQELGWKTFDKTWDEIFQERVSGLTTAELRELHCVPDQQSGEEEEKKKMDDVVRKIGKEEEERLGRTEVTEEELIQVTQNIIDKLKVTLDDKALTSRYMIRMGLATMYLISVTYPFKHQEGPALELYKTQIGEKVRKYFKIEPPENQSAWFALWSQGAKPYQQYLDAQFAFDKMFRRIMKGDIETVIDEQVAETELILKLKQILKKIVPEQQSGELTVEETEFLSGAVSSDDEDDWEGTGVDALWNYQPVPRWVGKQEIDEDSEWDWSEEIPEQQSGEFTVADEGFHAADWQGRVTFPEQTQAYNYTQGDHFTRQPYDYQIGLQGDEGVERDYWDVADECENILPAIPPSFKGYVAMKKAQYPNQYYMVFNQGDNTEMKDNPVRHLYPGWMYGTAPVLQYPEDIPVQQSGEQAVSSSQQAKAPAPQPMDTTNLQENQTVTSPSATQATITGTFGDNTAHEQPAQTQTSAVVTPGRGDDPYVDQGIGTVISREYEIDTITWSYNDATGVFLWSGDLPDLLLDIPNISEKLDRFQYFRTAVRLTFRINGVVMHFGCLQITYCPHYNSATNVQRYFQTMYTASNLGAHFLSANTNATVDILVPYVTPSRFQNLKDKGSEPGFVGMVAAHVLAPLTLEAASSTPELTISVFAHFELPKAAGLGLRVDVIREKEVIRKYKKFIKQKMIEKGNKATKEELEEWDFLSKIPDQQSGEQDVKTEKKTQSSKYSKAAKQKTEGIVKPIMGEAMEILSFLSEAKGLLMDKPTDLQGCTKIINYPQSGLASGDGLDHCEPLSLTPDNKVAYDISLYGQDKDYNLFKNYKLRPSLVWLGEWHGSDVKGTRIVNMPITPAYVHKTQTAMPTVIHFNVTNIGNLGQFFRCWRGGMKLLLKTFGSKFTSGRVVLKWLPDPTYNSAMANNVFGDVVFHMIDATGDTDYCFTVPWLRERAWEIIPDFLSVELGNITSWDGINGQLVIEVSNPLTISDSAKTPIVYMALYWAGAEDFDVSRPRQPLYVDDSVNGPVTARQGKTRLHGRKIPDQQSADIDVTKTTDCLMLFTQSVFPSMVPATMAAEKFISMGETPESWTQLFRRFTIVQRTVLTGAPQYNDWYEPFSDNIASGTRDWPMHRMLRAFHYKRGSFRIKALLHWTTAIVEMEARNYYINFPDPDDYGMCGKTWTVTNIRQWLEFQIPFYYQYDMCCNAQFVKEHENIPSAHIRCTNAQSSTTAFAGELLWYASLGDDFSLGWPTSPIPLKFIVPADNKEQKQKTRA